VIGSGPGGYVAAIRAAQLGLKVACVEKAELGGICLNWGCIPTKALLRTAEVLELFHRAGEFGLKAGAVEVDFPAVIKRSRDVAAKISKGVAFLLKKNGIEHIGGTARLLPRPGAWRPHQVEVAIWSPAAPACSTPATSSWPPAPGPARCPASSSTASASSSTARR
jgi:pyruvate/2-oxoglutarate dehydrogenase complex dihydrolipoamide dehydrogenase (E3) component